MTLLYEELSQKIIRSLFNVYNALGFGYKEKEYQKALCAELEKQNLGFERELYSNIKYENRIISKFYVDFLIEGKVVLELKVANDFYLKHRQQVIQYLKNHNLRVGLIAIFTPQKVLVKRIVN